MYLKYIQANFRSNLQYKGWPITVVQTLFVVVTDPIAVFLLFARFGDIGEWSAERIMLVYALAVTSFGLAECFCRGFDVFPWGMIRSGKFDRVLLRPRAVFTQVAGSAFSVSRFSRITGGLFAIGWALSGLGAELSAADTLMLLLALAGGTLAYSGVFVFSCGLAFFTVQALDWIYIFSNGSYQIAKCPIDLLPKALRNTFTFIMPMFVVSYYPASAMLGWGEAYWKGWLAFPAGLGFLLVSTVVWRVGVRHYKGTGS
jgi:ABC-2 type transport system permease protein